MGYPATTLESRVARCYVCDEVGSKTRMLCVGPSREEEGLWIFRHEECHAGSPNWLRYYFHRSAIQSLFKEAKERSEADRLVQEQARKERAASRKNGGREELSEEDKQTSWSAAPARKKGEVVGKASWRIAKVRRARRKR